MRTREALEGLLGYSAGSPIVTPFKDQSVYQRVYYIFKAHFHKSHDSLVPATQLYKPFLDSLVPLSFTQVTK